MAFISIRYIIFFIAIYLLNWIYINTCHYLKQTTYKTYSILLLFESYVFIIVSDWKTAVVLFAQTVLVFFVSKAMKKHKENKILFNSYFAIGIVFSIGQLVIYKYCDFIAETIFNVSGVTYADNIIPFIPLGISFFTFSVVGYLIDLHRGRYEVIGSFSDLALYLSFIPKFISGPIVRADKLMNQVKKGYSAVNLTNLQIGIQYVVMGMFKKMVLSDHLAVFVDDVYRSPSAFNSLTCVWAIISYSLQIYFDFSGYSDMAIGFSKMLGINIDKNFDMPYISRNITEFWKRWHISLSAWLQDYLYISLGGNRKGKIRTYINLVTTMLIGGLWHGASWNFLIWGGIHGIALVIHKQFIKFTSKKEITKNNHGVWSSVVTYIFVCITWVFFRANTFSQAIEILKRSVTFCDGVQQIYTWTFFAIAFALWEIAYSRIKNKRDVKDRLELSYPIFNLNKISGLFAFFVFIGLTIILAYVGQVAFIYGKF